MVTLRIRLYLLSITPTISEDGIGTRKKSNYMNGALDS